MAALLDLFFIVIFPGGLSLLALGLLYEWLDRKLLARLQNRVGPRWFQPLADTVKLLAKEEVRVQGSQVGLFILLPLIALAGALAAGVYVPLFGLETGFGFPGDLVVTIYLLSLLTLCTGLAGANSLDRFSLLGATRALTQLFSYEVPFLLAMLGPALVAGSWQISEITAYASDRWLILSQPLGFLIALIGLVGKLEMPPLDAPKAKTEIVAGALTEYSGRGLALFHLGKSAELVVGLTLIATFYLGGVGSVWSFALKTLALLLVIVLFQALSTRLRIDQSVGLWWRYGTLLVLLQWLGLILWEQIG